MPRVTGRLQSDTHTIEKVIFESLPGFYITANLYRPNIPGRYPAVLVPSGHTQEGKPETQIVAANLAAKGFIALAYDPIGQGEREQTYLPQLGRALSGGGGNEHLELGARNILIGQSVARYFIFDAKRAVDYLVSRPDVDPDRIGVTGCSGGGAITTYVGVFEPRVKAAAPGCFINSFRTLFTGPTADSEMSFPAFLASGLDMADFFEVAAPLPWLMMATTEDYFPPDGARAVYTEARRWYELYGAGDRIRFFVGTGPHGTPRDSREEIYRWMIRWLAGGKGDPRDQPVKLYTNLELQVTQSGNVDGEPGSRKLHQIIADEFRARRQKRGVPELLAELRRLGVPSKGPAPSATTTSKIEDTDFRIEEIRFESEPGVTVSARLYLPKGAGRKPAVVMFEEKRLPVPLYVQRSQSTAAIAEALARSGQIVMEVDPRDSPAANDGRPFLGNWLTNERAELVGRNLAAMRAHDLLVAVDVLAARPDVDAELDSRLRARRQGRVAVARRRGRPAPRQNLARPHAVEHRCRARRSADEPPVRRDDPPLRAPLGFSGPRRRYRRSPRALDRSDELDEPRGAARRAVSLPLCGRRRRPVDRGIPPVSLCFGATPPSRSGLRSVLRAPASGCASAPNFAPTRSPARSDSLKPGRRSMQSAGRP